MVEIEKIKTLRELTQAPIGLCKEALEQAQGDIEKAKEYLHQKGLLKAEAKKEKETKAGVISAYIHPGDQLGVLLELKSETDFVAKNKLFKELAHQLALHIAGLDPQYLKIEDIPESEKEKKISQLKEEFKEKPKEIQEKIIEEKLKEWYREVCLMEQPFLKNNQITVKELIADYIAKLGENIEVSRFARFSLY